MTSSERETANEVLKSSCLQRRRQSARYKLVQKVDLKNFSLTLLLMLGLFVFAALMTRLLGIGSPRDSQPAGEPVLDVDFERFCITRLVRPNDTLSGIAREYYGKSTPAHIQGLLDANPSIEDRDRIGKADTVRIPLKDGGCRTTTEQ